MVSVHLRVCPCVVLSKSDQAEVVSYVREKFFVHPPARTQAAKPFQQRWEVLPYDLWAEQSAMPVFCGLREMISDSGSVYRWW